MGKLIIKDVTLELGGSKILDGLNIDFWDGHIHALVGPNGAGKSTTAFTIMGLEGYRHFSGDIQFMGKSIKNMPIDERARLGITLAWQEPARYEGMRVSAFIKASAKDKSPKAVSSVLDKVGINPDEYLNRAVDKTLSGGERKKIELASILAMKPKLVMLDEPDSGIDVASLNRIFESLKYLKEIGATVILITHSMEVLSHAENAFLICCGKIVDKGDISKITKYFSHQCIPCDHKNHPSFNGGK
ncbi:ABC transporter ATP-binding protein [bacterium]|nr:ABC transporter ATP-binding protein [bacterium]